MKIQCYVTSVTENTTGPAEPGGPRGKQRVVNVQPVRPDEKATVKATVKWGGNLQAVCEDDELDKLEVNQELTIEVG